MNILDFKINRNEKRKFKVRIDENNSIPMWVVCGKNEGKTLVLTAGVHGCEYIGIETAKKVYNEIYTNQLSGTIIIFPLVNKSGFYGGLKQIVAEDNKNLNRLFPANPNGTLADKIACFFESKVYPLADFILDLHSGDINEKMNPLVFCPSKANEEVIKIAKEVTNGMPINIRVPSTSTNGLYGCCVQKGTPAVLLEIGGEAKFSDDEIKLCFECVKSTMAYFNMSFEYKINDNQKESSKTDYLEAVSNGYWYQNLQVGLKVKKGDPLGVLKNIDDEVIKTYIADFDGTIFYYTTSLGVKKGDNLIAYGCI